MADDRQQALDAFLGGAQAPVNTDPAPATSPRPAPRDEPSAPTQPDARKAALDDFLRQQRDAGHESDVARETERALDARIEFDAPSSDNVAGWLAQAGRAATMGVFDPVSALIVQYRMKDEVPDLTFAESLKAVRDGWEEEETIGAQLAGALVPGAAIGKGLTVAARAAAPALSQKAVVKGAMQWAGRNPKLGRIAAATAATAAGASTEEFIRESIDQTIGSFAGDGFDPGEVVDATITGALAGALFGGVGQAAARGIGSVPGVADVVGYIGAALNIGDSQAVAAARRIVNSITRSGETADQALARVQAEGQRFIAENGRPPALFEILPQEQVRDIAGIMRFHGGLDERARPLAEAGVQRSLKALREATASGATLKSPGQIIKQADEMFTDVMTRHGSTLVDVPADVIDALRPAKGIVGEMAKWTPGAQRIARIMDAQDSIAKFRVKASQLATRQTVADARADVAEIRQHIAELIDEEFQSAAVPPSEIAALKNLAQLLGAKANAMAAVGGAERAAYNAAEFRPLLDAAERAIADFEANGMKISLSDANDLRRKASAWSYSAMAQPGQAEAAREVNKAISRVGTREVPEYGQVVTDFSRAMTRSEAQALGRAAVGGSPTDPRDLAVQMDGRKADFSKVSANNKGAQRTGMTEGAVGEIDARVSGTGRQATTEAKRLSDPNADRLRENLRAVAPRQADRIIKASESTAKTYENALEMLGPRSQGSAAEEAAGVREAVTAGLFGNIGGAARAAWITRALMGAKVPRGVANRLIDMLGDPDQLPQALSYMQSRGIDLGAFFGAMVGATAGAAGED